MKWAIAVSTIVLLASVGNFAYRQGQRESMSAGSRTTGAVPKWTDSKADDNWPVVVISKKDSFKRLQVMETRDGVLELVLEIDGDDKMILAPKVTYESAIRSILKLWLDDMKRMQKQIEDMGKLPHHLMPKSGMEDKL